MRSTSVNKPHHLCAKLQNCSMQADKNTTKMFLFFYLKLLEKFTAKPQNVLDLFDPQECEVFGERQGHVPHLRQVGYKQEQSVFVLLMG